MSIQKAIVQCSSANRVEAAAHQQLSQLFCSVNMRLTLPGQHLTTVDSLHAVNQEQGTTVTPVQLRLQEEASHNTVSRRGRRRGHRVSMSRCGGALGRLAYASDDFDVLVACALHESRLQGVFLIPISTLVKHSFFAKQEGYTYVIVPSLVASETESHPAEVRLAAGLLPGPPLPEELRQAATKAAETSNASHLQLHGRLILGRPT